MQRSIGMVFFGNTLFETSGASINSQIHFAALLELF
jgi:hypothetical protein